MWKMRSEPRQQNVVHTSLLQWCCLHNELYTLPVGRVYNSLLGVGLHQTLMCKAIPQGGIKGSMQEVITYLMSTTLL